MDILLNFREQKKEKMHDDARRISEAAFVVIDTELTGLNERKDSIVSVGAVRMTGGRIFPGNPFYRLVKPKAALTRASVLIHGIVPSDVAAERDSAAVLSEFAGFCRNDILVGHCVGIDLEFINREMRRIHGTCLENQALDTAELYAWMADRRLVDRCIRLQPGEPELYRLARCFDIAVAEAHHALEDAFITAQLFQRFLPLLNKEGITAIGDLVRIGDPLRAGGRFRSAGEIGNL